MRAFSTLLPLLILGLSATSAVTAVTSDEAPPAAGDEASAPAEQTWKAQRREDLAVFASGFLARDRSYAAAARQEAEKRLDKLTASPPADGAAFELELAAIAALARNGHTTLLNPRWTGAYNRIPVRFLITDDGLFVGGADGQHADLVGCKVASIAGHDWQALRSAWSRYQGGQPGWRDQFIYHFIESPQVLHAAGIAPSGDGMRLTFTGCEPRSIPAETGLPPLTGFEAFIPPPRVLELSAAGRGGPAPLYLQDPASPFRAVPLPEQDAVYVQFRANADFAGRHDAAAFVRQAEADLRAARPRFVILDERFNFGGDLNITRGFIQALPEIVGPDGRVFVLTSGRTFSAGIASAAYARQAGGPQTILIGATPGDKLEFWAEGDLVTLPRSGATFMYATERHNYMTGCPEADCHGSIQQHPIRIESLDPDSPVPFTYADFKAGRDPLLEKALALIDQMR